MQTSASLNLCSLGKKRRFNHIQT